WPTALSSATISTQRLDCASAFETAGLRRCAVESSIALQNDVLDHRIDLVLPRPSREHAIMADAGLHVVALAIGPQRRAHVMRGERLPDRADIVLFAFHGEQHRALDRRGIHLLVLVGEQA